MNSARAIALANQPGITNRSPTKASLGPRLPHIRSTQKHWGNSAAYIGSNASRLPLPKEDTFTPSSDDSEQETSLLVSSGLGSTGTNFRVRGIVIDKTSKTP